MAEIKSFPNNQDVYVGAEWVMKWLHGRTSGVFGAENNLSTSIVPGTMSIEISDGVGWLSNDKGDGIVFWNDNEQTNGSKLRLTHDVADGALDRIDRIVVTWATTNYVALPTISILKGIASSNPKPPELTNNNIQRQISLRQQRIPAGAISISPAFGTDERLNPDVCGIVTENIKADTSVINKQFEELLELVKKNLKQITNNQILDKSITVAKLAEETTNYINSFNRVDNSDFLHFVAQAGIGGEHGNQAYAGDRWILDSGTVTGEENPNGNGYSNIQLNGTIRQIIADPPEVGSVFVEMISGTATAVYEDGEVTVTSVGGVIKNVALYEGVYTDENKPAYQPKGYGAELAGCKWYYNRSYGVVISKTGMLLRSAFASTRLIGVDMPCEMRTIPTVTLYEPNGSEKNTVMDYLTGEIIHNTIVVYAGNKSFIPGSNSSKYRFTEGKVYCFHYEASADF